jgi:hypothetical protein
MPPRTIHLVHLLVREALSDGAVGFLVYPHEHWKAPDGRPYLALPTKTTVEDPLAPLRPRTGHRRHRPE